QGVSPNLDFSDIDDIRRTVEHCNQLPVPARHPYAGDLVYTSFSGSHQDAIKKAFAARRDGDVWDMPYLPIDPQDLGRSYEAVIRVNSQSGKGGIAYLLESDYGLQLPRRLQMEFSRAVQQVMDDQGKELTSTDLWSLFELEYRIGHVQVVHQAMEETADGRIRLQAEVVAQGQRFYVAGEGNGPVDAFVDAIGRVSGEAVQVLDYHEHAIGSGAQAQAAAYLELRIGAYPTRFGVGIDANIVSASMKAVVGAMLHLGVLQPTALSMAAAAA
uniref:alpha-isopropylmalate synthase regulatory domain-containing protein n=1 Tax=Azohydromonas australica TaxID=364039 RepID=UPI0005B768CA